MLRSKGLLEDLEAAKAEIGKKKLMGRPQKEKAGRLSDEIVKFRLPC